MRIAQWRLCRPPPRRATTASRDHGGFSLGRRGSNIVKGRMLAPCGGRCLLPAWSRLKIPLVALLMVLFLSHHPLLAKAKSADRKPPMGWMSWVRRPVLQLPPPSHVGWAFPVHRLILYLVTTFT